jgi:dephospho-CoA kinase
VGGLSDHVFGYGSLVLDGIGVLETLPGHRRVWGVATDNVRMIPGYKMYLDRADGSRPEIYVAFVDLEPDPASSVRGLVRPVSEPELAQLDRRERNYDRIDVTDLIEADFGGPVWTYRGSAEGRARLDRGRAEGRAVVSRDYLEKVHAGLRPLGDDEYERFLSESDLPVRDLERVDL